MTYTKKGISTVQMEELLELTNLHAPFLTGLIEHLDKQSLTLSHLCQCPPKWKNFLHCVGSASPVCALVPATDEALELIRAMCDKDITSDPEVSHNLLFLLWKSALKCSYSGTKAPSGDNTSSL